MRIACLGGGPAGLYFAISMKLRDPRHQIDLLERNRALRIYEGASDVQKFVIARAHLAEHSA